MGMQRVKIKNVSGGSGPHFDLDLLQAGASDIELIALLEGGEFGEDAVPVELLREWYGACPRGFFLLVCDDELVGHIDIIPFRGAVWKAYMAGKVLETALRADSIVPWEQRDSIEELYVESVIMPYRPRQDRPGLMNASVKFVTKNFIPLVAHLCGAKRPEFIYAMAATDGGIDLTDNLGFKVRSKGECRVDHHDFLRIDYQQLLTRMREGRRK